jgi:hypothetical protein
LPLSCLTASAGSVFAALVALSFHTPLSELDRQDISASEAEERSANTWIQKSFVDGMIGKIIAPIGD